MTTFRYVPVYSYRQTEAVHFLIWRGCTIYYTNTMASSLWYDSPYLALSSSVLTFLNHIQLDAGYNSSGRVNTRPEASTYTGQHNM
jgi:hypothetical protein